MDEIKEKYDYEPFADTEEYREVNEACIHGWIEIMRRKGLSGIEAILDVATGAGTMVQIVFDQLPASWKKAAVMCLDQSSEALRLAQSKLEKTVERLKLVHSSVEDMTIPDASIDVAVWGNGIHYLSEQEQLDSIKRIKQALSREASFSSIPPFTKKQGPRKLSVSTARRLKTLYSISGTAV